MEVLMWVCVFLIGGALALTAGAVCIWAILWFQDGGEK